jgi:hypothetical protein
MSVFPHSGTVGHRACSFDIEEMAHTIYQNMHNPFSILGAGLRCHLCRAPQCVGRAGDGTSVAKENRPVRKRSHQVP